MLVVEVGSIWFCCCIWFTLPLMENCVFSVMVYCLRVFNIKNSCFKRFIMTSGLLCNKSKNIKESCKATCLT